jgi:DNA-binding GntR family transcriptional regulator
MAVPPKKPGRGRRKESSDIPLAGSAKLDRDSGVPLYYQLAAGLKDKLDTGNWPPESRFPTEREIAEEFGVSRSVIRPALNLLVGDGAIVRKQGSGAFVTAPRLEFPIFSLTKALVDPPPQLTLTILAAREETAKPAVAAYLEIEPRRAPIIHVSVLMQLQGKPICFMESYTSSPLAPWLLQLVRALRPEQRPSHPPAVNLGRATASIELTFFGPWAGPQLEASPGDPALIGRLVQFVGDFSGEEVPLEFAYVVYRTDITQLAIELG